MTNLFWEYQFLGQSIKIWATAFTVCAGLIVSFSFIRQFLIYRVDAIAKKTATKLDDLLSDVLKATGKSFIVGLSVYASAQLLRLSPKAELITHRLFILLALYQVAVFGKAAIRFWINSIMRERANHDTAVATTLGLVSFAAKMALYTIIVLLALTNLGVDITALVAGLGVGGIAIALAVQNILGDLFASLTIVLDKPFVVGDAVEVDSLGGSVEHIGLKTTRIRSITGEQLIFSNSDLLKSRIRNFGRLKERRVAFTLLLDQKSTPEQVKQAKKILQTTVQGQANTRFDRVNLKAITDSALQLECIYFFTTPNFNAHAECFENIQLGIIAEFEKTQIHLAESGKCCHQRA